MRKAGILLHITSLPGNYGIGSMGKEAYRFVDFLKKTNQSYWQVLPLTPTELGNSPYQSPGVFAGNPELIDLDDLKDRGLLMDEDFDGQDFGDDSETVNYIAVKAAKNAVLRTAFQRFKPDKDYSVFLAENEFWIENYALFMALKEHFGELCWYEWDDDIKFYEADAVKSYTSLLWDDISFYKFQQYIFSRQWAELKAYANENGVKIIGDIPIYVSPDSCDVWVNRKQFQLLKDGRMERVAGCPPDAFSADGQLWGNPLYNWNVMKKDGFSWWINRMKLGFRLYDVIRLDHFRGFEAYFSIPAEDPDAKNGEWVKGPGMSLFKAIKKQIPDAEIIAEDLGHLTDGVYKLLSDSGFPGMKVLQFAFDPYNDNPYLPYNYPENCVAYTGTHDNDTLIGWYAEEANKEFIRDYLNVATDEYVPVAMVRAILASRAKTAIIPLQDYLGYGRRMNTPSTANEENWSWRVRSEAFSEDLAYHISHLTELYKRA